MVVSAPDPFTVDFWIRVSSNAVSGWRDVKFVNSDGAFSNLLTPAATFTVTAPVAEVTYPVEGNGISGPAPFTVSVSSIGGTAGFSPADGQTQLSTTQVRITFVSDPAGLNTGKFFTGSGWTSVNTWVQSTAAAPTWGFFQFSAQDAGLDYIYQDDGGSYKIEARGLTGDGGVGNPPVTPVEFTIDKKPPTVVTIAPKANSSNGASFTSINGTARDPGAGMLNFKLLVCDVQGSASKATLTDDSCWNPAGPAWGPANGTEYYYGPPGEASWPALPLGADAELKTWDVFNTDGADWPVLQTARSTGCGYTARIN